MNKDIKIVGVGHYSRTGKDTFADMLIAECTALGKVAKKVPLAWKLKQVCHELYGWAGLREPEFYDTEEGAPFRDIVIGPIGKTPVDIWVYFGTQAVRHNVYDRTWIDYVLYTDHQCDLLIVPDIRFPNEVEIFREEGAKMLKCIRPGYGPRRTIADTALVGFWDWDLLIGGGGVEELRKNAADIAPWCCGEEFPSQSRDEFTRLQHMEKPC